jgi:Ring finger domain
MSDAHHPATSTSRRRQQIPSTSSWFSSWFSDRRGRSNVNTTMWNFTDEEFSSASLQMNTGDDVVTLVAQQMGVRVPLSQAYPAHSSQRTVRHEPQWSERELQQQQQRHHHGPSRRGPASMMPPPVKPTLCNPVSPMVLQNLPIITVRYIDLYPDAQQGEDDGSFGEDSVGGVGCGCRNDNPLESSMSSISIGMHREAYCCSICHDEVKVATTAVRLPCAHVYHTDCITTWLSKFSTCPICRYTLPTLADFPHSTSSSGSSNNSCRMKLPWQRQQQQDMQQQQQRPIQYTIQELHQLSIPQLNHLYTSWIICTHQPHQKFPMEIPTHIVDKRSLIDYMMECQVVTMLSPPKVTETTNSTSSSGSTDMAISPPLSYMDLHNMSIRELKSLLLAVQKHEGTSSFHIVEKQDLIDYILMEQQQQQHHP